METQMDNIVFNYLILFSLPYQTKHKAIFCLLFCFHPSYFVNTKQTFTLPLLVRKVEKTKRNGFLGNFRE